MSILNLIKEDESLEFISLKEAINLLATKTKSTTFGIATYLLNKKVQSTLDCYSRDIDYKLYASSSANYTGCGWVGENYAFQWLQYIAENEKHLKKFSVSNTDKYNNGCEESFWKRADFFNLECIKSLNLFDTKELQRGRPSRLPLEDQLLMTLSYWREYRTLFHTAMSYGVHESSASRIITKIENILIKSKKFHLPKKLPQGQGIDWEVVVVDATEMTIECPKKTKEIL